MEVMKVAVGLAVAKAPRSCHHQHLRASHSCRQTRSGNRRRCTDTERRAQHCRPVQSFAQSNLGSPQYAACNPSRR
eukprot:3928253-Prymnesium_polylepis.1